MTIRNMLVVNWSFISKSVHTDTSTTTGMHTDFDYYSYTLVDNSRAASGKTSSFELVHPHPRDPSEFDRIVQYKGLAFLSEVGSSGW